jgi:hypothetical protein
MENEVAKVEGNPYLAMMQKMVESGNVAQLKDMMDLQERWEAGEAKKVYSREFANTQLEIETVVKTKKNTQTHSNYADLSDIIESSKPIYTKHGFAIIFSEGDTAKDNHVRIIADVLHEIGHKETYHYDVPLDGAGLKGNANMIPIHGKASSVSYGRRYLMCMIWNIATGDDNDGNNQAPVQRLTDVQQAMLCKKIQDCKTNGELKEAYSYAIGQADILKDKESQLMFVAEKDKKLKELNPVKK